MPAGAQDTTAPPSAIDTSGIDQAPPTAPLYDATIVASDPVVQDAPVAPDTMAETALDAAPDASLNTVPDTSLDPAALAALAVNDPEMAAIMSAIVLPRPNLSMRWDESASRDFYSSVLALRWQHTLGDYQPTPLGTATVPDLDRQITVSIPVTGNDFYVLGDGTGTANFLSRHGSATLGPVLIVNGTTRYNATRDVALSDSLAGTLKGKPTMADRNAMLIAFDTYAPKAGDRAVMKLTSTAQYGTHTVTAYPTNVVRSYPVIDAVQDGTVVADFRAGDFAPRPYQSVTGGYLTSYWETTRGTALAQVFSLPPAQEYFLTTVIRLHSDWSNQGGKLPGLTNTGQGTNPNDAPLTVDGQDCSNAGWGGRTANGCRWSARTGWGGRLNGFVGIHTYYYAVAPNVGWGNVEDWPTPLPVARWVAYVERVRVNTPGQADGRLSYWLCTPNDGCLPQFDRQTIQWRNADVPQALITEAWADVYCGGVGCPGPNPWPRSTIDLERMTVTVGLPDLGALAGELQGLNAQP